MPRIIRALSAAPATPTAPTTSSALLNSPIAQHTESDTSAPATPQQQHQHPSKHNLSGASSCSNSTATSFHFDEIDATPIAVPLRKTACRGDGGSTGRRSSAAPRSSGPNHSIRRNIMQALMEQRRESVYDSVDAVSSVNEIAGIAINIKPICCKSLTSQIESVTSSEIVENQQAGQACIALDSISSSPTTVTPSDSSLPSSAESLTSSPSTNGATPTSEISLLTTAGSEISNTQQVLPPLPPLLDPIVEEALTQPLDGDDDEPMPPLEYVSGINGVLVPDVVQVQDDTEPMVTTETVLPPSDPLPIVKLESSNLTTTAIETPITSTTSPQRPKMRRSSAPSTPIKHDLNPITIDHTTENAPQPLMTARSDLYLLNPILSIVQRAFSLIAPSTQSFFQTIRSSRPSTPQQQLSAAASIALPMPSDVSAVPISSLESLLSPRLSFLTKPPLSPAIRSTMMNKTLESLTPVTRVTQRGAPQSAPTMPSSMSGSSSSGMSQQHRSSSSSAASSRSNSPMSWSSRLNGALSRLDPAVLCQSISVLDSFPSSAERKARSKQASASSSLSTLAPPSSKLFDRIHAEDVALQRALKQNKLKRKHGTHDYTSETDIQTETREKKQRITTTRD